MAETIVRRRSRCAIYTRKSSEEGLEQAFNSLHAQREACEAYVNSQKHEGWSVLNTAYDDGGFSGGSMERPGLKRLMADIAAGQVDVVVVYKIDRLTRSLFDFAKMVEGFDAQQVSFVSITQAFNTSTSMGRLTLNVLLSFAQFEREVTGERIRDKIAASKKKGMWMGGVPPLGYDIKDRKLFINDAEAKTVRAIFETYLELKSLQALKSAVDRKGIRTKVRISQAGRKTGGLPISFGNLYEMLRNPLYAGRIHHKGETYSGEHDALIDDGIWARVQSQLETNARDRRSGANVTEQSLLLGRVFDATGQKMTPSHTNKKGQRYRYYVSHNLITGQGKGVRVPAGEIEGAVLDQVSRLLGNQSQILELVRAVDVPTAALKGALERASALREKLTSGAMDQRAALQDLIQRVDLGESSLKIAINTNALSKLLVGHNLGDSPPHILEVSVELRRHAKKVKLAVGGKVESPGRDLVLIKAIARAHKWFEMLRCGEAKSVSDIARAEQLNRTYVSSLMPLAFLPPTDVRAALAGSRSGMASLDQLIAKPPQLRWKTPPK